MFTKNHIHSDCYGCFACVDICPVNTINVNEFSDTFLYPTVDYQSCIHCDKCVSVCPKEKNLKSYPISALVGVVKNHSDWYRSSSGGAFKSIVMSYKRLYNDKHIFVCGAVFNHDFKTVHKLMEIQTEEDVNPFCKSKYMQSFTQNCYSEILHLLSSSDNIIIFCGTPCQVAAIKNYCKSNDDRLILIDLICHGAPSQRVFDKYRDHLEKSRLKLIKYNFRNKDILSNGTIYSRSVKAFFSDGSSYEGTRHNDDYLRVFHMYPYHFRPSCYNCDFRTPERVGDFTIGDAWHIDEIYEDINPIQGYSLITFNDKKSLKIQAVLSDYMELRECSYQFMVEKNASLRENRKNDCPDEIIERFWEDIYNDNVSFSKCVDNYVSEILRQGIVKKY